MTPVCYISMHTLIKTAQHPRAERGVLHQIVLVRIYEEQDRVKYIRRRSFLLGLRTGTQQERTS